MASTAAEKKILAAERLRALKNNRVEFCRRLLNFTPHAGQVKWLRAREDPGLWHTDPKTGKLVEPNEFALVTGNRFGKSFIAAADIIFDCVFLIGWNEKITEQMRRLHHNYQAINVSITADQANLVWYKAHSMLQGPVSYLVRDVKMTPFPTITFITGATFQARSTAGNGHHLLGHDYDRVNWDEAAFDPKFINIRDNVIRNRLVDRAGRLTYTSTGNGRNEFGRYVLDGIAGKELLLYSQFGKSYENPNIVIERLTQNAGRMSDKMRRQNIEGEIVDAGDFFPAEDLAEACDTTLDDMLRIHAVDEEDVVAWAEVFADKETPWRRRYPSHRYVTFWDIANKQDWTVGLTFDISYCDPKTKRRRITLVEFERFQKTGWAYVKARVRDRHARYRGISGMDATGVGDPVLEDLRDIISEEHAIIFTKQLKDKMLDGWRQMINLRQVRWPSIIPFVEEHGFYQRNDESIVNDCVMSAIGAGHMMLRGIANQAPASLVR